MLPIEVSCYASDEEITRAIKPLIEQHFPVETQTPHKVVYSKILFIHYGTNVMQANVFIYNSQCIFDIVKKGMSLL